MAVLIALCAGCSSKPATSDSNVNGAADARVRDFLVWARPRSGSREPTTTWIRTEGAARTVMGTVPGVFVTSDKQVWRWSTRETKLPRHCDSTEPLPDVLPRDGEALF